MGAGNPPRFGTDGVRGAAYTELTTDFVTLLGRAVARVLRPPTVYVGQDTRASSPDFAAAVCRGLAEEGVTVRSVGIVPTPALAWLAAADGVGAVMITASHNPYGDNGVKVFAVGGTKLTDAVEAGIEGELGLLIAARDGHASGTEPLSQSSYRGSVAEAPHEIDRYVTHLVDSFGAGSLDGVHVVVDCANGAMSDVAPLVLGRLGARLTVLASSPDGTNINDRCGATHPEVMLDTVRSVGAHAGLAFDGDGDRVIAAAPNTGLIDGDHLLAVMAPMLRESGSLRGDAVVVTVMSNLGFRRAMSAQGIRVVETPVGDRYVLEAIEREGLVLGGEQSGHIIVRDRSTTGDGLLAGVLLLERAQATGRTLDDVASGAMTTYPQVLVNVRTARRDPRVAELVADEITAVERELAGAGRVLVRPSGTEPVVRVMVEAIDPAMAQQCADRLAAVIADRLA